MKRALIGHTGFVGSNLAAQGSYDAFFRSRNIEDMAGQSYDLVVCAGIQAKKWWANDHAEEDRQGIRRLLDVLATVRAGCMVLISTVDVYPQPSGVDEDSPIDPGINHAYGRNRFEAEQSIRALFPSHVVVRLPGLFGEGIKKNVIHDLLHDHELHKINPAGVYQYYSLDRIQADIDKAVAMGIPLVNFSAEPVSTREIIGRFFPDKQVGPETAFKASYDMHSKYADAWGSKRPGYLFSRGDVLGQLEVFLGRHGVRSVSSNS
ncbi:MAG: hypothetical protein SFU85_13390 [Candidatus Methylacidiphilales bacterium]|nr:hypothetical protein [Candidatus Methylacidiphilales bacterium]